MSETDEPKQPTVTLWDRGYRAQLIRSDGTPGPLISVVQTLDGCVCVPDSWDEYWAAKVDQYDYRAVPLPH